jgi:hypothetical protein
MNPCFPKQAHFRPAKSKQSGNFSTLNFFEKSVWGLFYSVFPYPHPFPLFPLSIFLSLYLARSLTPSFLVFARSMFVEGKKGRRWGWGGGGGGVGRWGRWGDEAKNEGGGDGAMGLIP